MQVGFNYPQSYNRFGSEIGPNIHVPEEMWRQHNDLEAANRLSEIPMAPLFNHVDRNLKALKDLGISVVRWFLLGNGNSYGPAPTRKRISVHDYEFEPPSRIDRRFRRDFTELLVRFKKFGLQIIPSLISFEFGGEQGDKVGAGPPPGAGWGGRADVIREPAKRKVFLDTMLGELLAASVPFKDQIYAWEVINEPIWLCLEFGPLSRPNEWMPRVPEVRLSVMNEFLKDATARIQQAGFRSTVGHRYFDDLKRLEPGSAPQFHYYNEYSTIVHRGTSYKTDPRQIRGQKLFTGVPKPFLGEFDSRSDRFGNAWADDLPHSDSTLERLLLLETEGCDLAMIWPELGGAKPGRVDDKIIAAELEDIVKHDRIKLLPETLRSIDAFTHRVVPKAP